jgi:DNA-binding transcriptional MerR regulator
MSELYEVRIQELARAGRMPVTEVRRYQRAGCLVVETGGPVTDRELRRLRRVRRLRRDLDLQLEAIGIIVRLVERLEELQTGTQ